ncbi:E3 ubiquitin-protein ligase HUWE1-like [Solenopsis invicta]|uniref:E3 ubiquitin-protein ligase HUWE1-like n=1 Tax=Solenopsis invicta TaxID=13686 RepID=UPI000E3402A7|nr:E3 ubiquitin-protein ligase HUWE1-like [Solenopsis invicta]
MNCIQKFQIHREDRSTDKLPSAHTFFNQLDLLVYETYDKLYTNLLMNAAKDLDVHKLVGTLLSYNM